MTVGEWEIRVTNELLAWIGTLDERTRAQVVDAIDRLAEAGPALGRPLVDSIAHSSIRNLKRKAASRWEKSQFAGQSS